MFITSLHLIQTTRMDTCTPHAQSDKLGLQQQVQGALEQIEEVRQKGNANKETADKGVEALDALKLLVENYQTTSAAHLMMDTQSKGI